jgi:hypothetical protein
MYICGTTIEVEAKIYATYLANKPSPLQQTHKIKHNRLLEWH